MTTLPSLFDIQDTDGFEAFWQVWPTGRKVDKKAARKAFVKALKIRGVTATMLIDGAKAYDRFTEHRERQFVLHPTTWLNRERWNDEVVETPDDPRGSDPKGRRRQDGIRRYFESTQGLSPGGK